MLRKLAQQTAIYGISTILVRFLSYLLTPYYTRVFGQETYGIVTDVYALIPLALTLLTMGLESGYFRFATKAEEAGGDVKRSKQRLFATTWGVTTWAAVLFVAAVAVWRTPLAAAMGEAYAAHPIYLTLVSLIILLDVATAIPFARLREERRSMCFVGLKLLSVVVNVVLAFGFGMAGLFATDFGVGWVFVANLVASLITWFALLPQLSGKSLGIDRALLRRILIYSLPLLIGGLAGTANEFIDRQLIKYLVPEGAMADLGLYGALTKLGVVMMLFYQMYRLAAEPYFLSGFKKEEFKLQNAAALKYYVMASMLIFLGIALFRDLFALILGREFREGVYLLPVVLGGNILAGVWLNLSFWYKREERTSMALLITGTGLVVTVTANCLLLPHYGYAAAAWVRLFSEGAMVAVSIYLNRRFYPTPYAWGRMVEFAVVALVLFFTAERITAYVGTVGGYVAGTVALLLYVGYLIRREKIDVKAMVLSIIKR